MDFEGGRYGRGACRLMPAGCFGWGLTNKQTRYVPGSVEGIVEALAWAGLDYDYGGHAFVSASLDNVG